MTEEMEKFPGPIMMVTHNEDLLNRLATKLIVFRGEMAAIFNGTYDEFLEKVGWEEDTKKRKKKKDSGPKEDKKQRAEQVQERAKKLKPLKREAEKIEQKIARCEAEVAEKNALVMKAIQEGRNGSEIQELYKEIGALQLTIESHYEDLAHCSEKIERIEKEHDSAKR